MMPVVTMISVDDDDEEEGYDWGDDDLDGTYEDGGGVDDGEEDEGDDCGGDDE